MQNFLYSHILFILWLSAAFSTSASASRRIESFDDPYCKRQKLGSGTYGAVYIDEELPLTRVVKVSPADDLNSRSYHNMIEAIVTGVLTNFFHPNLPHSEQAQYVTKNGNLFLEMELHRCKTMSKIKKVDFTPHLLFDIAQALKFLHSLGLAHRDISPNNILLDDKFQGEPVFVLSDLGAIGSAKIPSWAEMTVTAFAAPEKLFDIRDKEQASDIWALAASYIFLKQIDQQDYFCRCDLSIEITKDFQLRRIARLLFGIRLAKIPENFEEFLKLTKPIDLFSRLRFLFPELSINEISILGKMLDPDPKTRITAAQILELEGFKDLRNLDYPKPDKSISKLVYNLEAAFITIFPGLCSGIPEIRLKKKDKDQIKMAAQKNIFGSEAFKLFKERYL